MRRSPTKIAAAAIAMALAAPAHATTNVTVPFRGVTRYERIEPAGVVAAGKQVINILEIDLNDPTISLFLTPSNGADPGEVTGATTRNFLTANSLQFAINGMRWSDAVTPNPNHYFEVNAISVADGAQVSPWAGGGLPEGAINLSSSKSPTLVTKTNPNSTSYATVPSITLYNTIGGRNLILKAGVVQPPLADDSNVANPRTGVAFKNGFLYTVTIDGRDPGVAEGMTVTEMATLLKNDYGATDMVNLDGGGSTTLVFADTTPRVINTPSDGSERLVANNVGFRATVMREWKVNSSANWNTASNWTIGIPNAEGAAVRFGTVITTPRTITSNTTGGATVGLLQFDHTVSYTLAGTQPLSLNATTGNAVIDVKRGSHTITTPLTLVDATDLTVASGATLNFGSTVTPSTSIVLTKRGDGTLNLNTSLSNVQLTLSGGVTSITTGQTLAGFGIASGSTATVTAGGVRTINTNSIAATGTLDLKDQKLVTRTAAGTLTGSIYNGVQGLVQRGLNNGTGLITTMPAAASGLTTLAVARATETNYIGKTFGGVPITDADTLVMYTWNGDANLSGTVDADDYFAIDANYNKPATGFTKGDFNYDAILDGDDYALIDAAYSAHGSPFSAGMTAVPEPALLGIAFLFLLSRYSGRGRVRVRRS